jgi:hypothetical protein
MVKCGVLFEVRADFLNIMEMSVDFKGLIVWDVAKVTFCANFYSGEVVLNSEQSSIWVNM